MLGDYASHYMLPKIGHLFVTTPEGAAALNLLEGPTSPLHLSDGRRLKAPVSNRASPYTYEPSFFDLVVATISPEEPGLDVVRQRDNIVLYRFPSAVSARLAELVPIRPEFTSATINEITQRIMQRPQASAHFKPSGVSSAVFILRGYALKTTNQDAGVYYWFCWRR